MDEKTKEKLSDIDSLKKIEKNLKEEIARLQKVQDNLDSQAHSKNIRDEQSGNIKHQENMAKYAAEENRIEAKRIEAEKRIDTAETAERNLGDRLKMVEQREAKLVDLEERFVDLNKQRTNFENYKINITAQLNQAQETINQSKEMFDKIESEKMMLAGREAKVRKQEKYWNDTIGLLEADKKSFQAEKENFIGLSKAKQEGDK